MRPCLAIEENKGSPASWHGCLVKAFRYVAISWVLEYLSDKLKAEKCLERLKEAHNRDSLIENLGKEKVKWQETAECLDTTVNNFRKSFEDIRIWMESLCLALGISLGDLKDKLTNQVISTAIKKLIHEKAQLEKEADWLAGWLAKCDDLPCPEHPCSRSGKDGCLQCWRDAARKKMGKNEANSGSN